MKNLATQSLPYPLRGAISTLSSLILIGSLFFHSYALASTKKPDEKSEWKSKMHELRGELVELSPYLYSESEYAKKNNQQKVLHHLDKILSIGHKFESSKQDKKFSPSDLSLTFMLHSLNEELKLARDSYKEGNYLYSKSVMKSAVSRCFQCHTQNIQKDQWQSGFHLASTKFLSSAEKADFLIAMRNFVEAEKTLKSSLLDYQGKTQNALDVEMTLRRYIMVLIRIHESPKEALGFIRQMKEKPELPPFLLKSLNAFEESLLQWKNYSKSTPLEAAKSLLKVGEKKQDYVNDAKGFIENLRASIYLHDYLLKEKKLQPKEKALAYFYLGEVYQNISEPSYWNLSNIYYEGCINTTPHSELSQKCYRRYEENLTNSFTGSAGTKIPLRERLKMFELQKSAL